MRVRYQYALTCERIIYQDNYEFALQDEESDLQRR